MAYLHSREQVNGVSKMYYIPNPLDCQANCPREGRQKAYYLTNINIIWGSSSANKD
jgi:hypothetical protein